MEMVEEEESNGCFFSTERLQFSSWKIINVQKNQLQYKSPCSTYRRHFVYLLAIVALRGRVKRTGLLDFIEKVDLSYGKGMFFLY